MSAVEYAHSLASRHGHTLTAGEATHVAEIFAADLAASIEMERLHAARVLSAATIAVAASHVWQGKPDQNPVDYAAWREMFTIGGFTIDHERARRPLCSRILYRGACDYAREGLSWTEDPSIAWHTFARYRQPHHTVPTVWRAKVPASRMLGRLTREREFIVDAVGLEMRALSDAETAALPRPTW